MKVSFQCSNNAKIISSIEMITGTVLTSAEAFKDEPDGHKFSIGQSCKLVGLEDYPEFNGQVVEISSFRKNGPHGKAYYFKADNSTLAKQLNWVYEYRLQKI